LPVLRVLQTRPWFGGRLMVSSAGKAFDDKGNLVDDQIRSQLSTFIAGFEAVIRLKS
jgi:hypothetical protein